jgi:hypothetical protein
MGMISINNVLYRAFSLLTSGPALSVKARDPYQVLHPPTYQIWISAVYERGGVDMAL